jgi:hypothetical protein
MGIDDRIMKEVVLQVAPGCKKEFHGNPPCMTPDKDAIYDFTALLYGVRKPTDEKEEQNDGYIMTLTEFYTAMRSLVLKLCTRTATGEGHINQLIICQDKREFVPPGKQFRKKTNPYRGEIELGDEGINEQGVWAKIDIRRLAESGSIATMALDNFVEHLRAAYHGYDPFPCPVTFDYARGEEPFCPIQFPSTDGEEPKFMEEWKNQLGETDLMIEFYLDILAPTSSGVCICHRDSDQLPLILAYFLARGPQAVPKPLHWIRKLPGNNPRTGNYEAGEMYDLIEIEKRIAKNDTFWQDLAVPEQSTPKEIESHRLAAFILFCMLCGMDWTEKKWLSDQVGVMDIFDAMCAEWCLWSIQIKKWTSGRSVPNPVKGEIESAEEANVIDRFLRRQYTILIRNREQKHHNNKRRRLVDNLPSLSEPKPWDEIRHYLQSQGLKKWNRNMTLNDQTTEDRKMARVRLRFVTWYWRESWRIHESPPTLIR